MSGLTQAVGWVCAVILPFAGFVIGCKCVSREPKREGVGMVVVSIVFALVWTGLLASG